MRTRDQNPQTLEQIEGHKKKTDFFFFFLLNEKETD